MSRWGEESQGPDDEVMPYSDDETDDELEVSTDEEADVPTADPQLPVVAKPSGEALF